MISGEIEINSFAQIRSVLEAKFGDEPLKKKNDRMRVISDSGVLKVNLGHI